MSRLSCVVCDRPLPPAAKTGQRCRPCAAEYLNGRRRATRRDARLPRRDGVSLRQLADPEGWDRHLERLAERAAKNLPLFD